MARISSASAVDLFVVEPRGGLIEQEKLGIDCQRPRKLHALAGRERQFAYRAVGDALEAEFLDQRVRPLGDAPLLALRQGKRQAR